MKAKDDFNQSILEVNMLNNVAKEETNNRTNKERTYYKAIVLLLCAKLEKYVKDSSREYCTELLNRNLKAENWPESFVIEILKNEIDIINKSGIQNYKNNSNNLKKSKVLELFWNDKFIIQELRDDFAISISNNGTTAISDIYKKIGFPNIVEHSETYEIETFDEFGVKFKRSIPILDTINRVIHMRHNIIHDDATPQLTESEIDDFILVFKAYVDIIDKKMMNNLLIL